MTNEPAQYYWCVCCGHHGKLNKPKKNIKCEKCNDLNTDLITKFTYLEIIEDEDLDISRFIEKDKIK